MITSHGKSRIKQRIGLTKNQAEHVEHAKEHGAYPENFRGGSAFKKFLNRKIEAHPNREFRVYGHYIYVFGFDGALITTYPVPKRFYDFLRKVF